jgi:hypothetical protein
MVRQLMHRLATRLTLEMEFAARVAFWVMIVALVVAAVVYLLPPF